MKLVLAIVNNDDSAVIAAELTRNHFAITKLSTTGGFLQTGNTTFLIGVEDDRVDKIKEIISKRSVTRKKPVPSTSAFGRGLAPNDISAEAVVSGATIFVLNVESYDKL